MAQERSTTPDYNAGGGEVMLALYNADGTTLGTEYRLKAVTEATSVNEPETVEIKDPSGKIPVTGDTMTSAVVTKFNMTVAEMSDEIIELLHMATKVAKTQAVATDEPVVFTGVKVGQYLSLGYYNITSIVVKDSTDAITYVEGVDYDFVADGGYIVPLSGGQIQDTDEIHTTVTAPAMEYTAFEALEQEQIYAQLRFVSAPKKGSMQVMRYRKVSMLPSGEQQLLSETLEYRKAVFECTALKHNGKVYDIDNVSLS